VEDENKGLQRLEEADILLAGAAEGQACKRLAEGLQGVLRIRDPFAISLSLVSPSLLF
jgi:hypothetical protein